MVITGRAHCYTFCIYIYIYIYDSVLVNEMSKSARYHIDGANSIVFTSKRLPLRLFHPRGIMKFPKFGREMP